MQNEKIIMFRNRLAKVYRHISKQAKRAGITCYRIYDHDLPEFPVCMELYGDKLYIAEYKRRHSMTEKEHDEWLKQTLAAAAEMLNIPAENISLKLRQRKAGRLGQYQKTDTRQQEFTVEENGLKFIVNLSDYLDTGLFLDHRLTRQIVKDNAAGKKVLNLFCYTGSFSVYAAAGGAGEVVSVDLSKTYLNWAERNFSLNGFAVSSAGYAFIHADVLQYLKTLPANYFDLVILDPPTFSNSKRMNDILDVQQQHVQLINDCLRVMKPAGILYFSTNYRRFILDEKNINAKITDITKATTPFDFEGKLSRACFKIEKRG